MFFHPGSYSAGCITFDERILNHNNSSGVPIADDRYKSSNDEEWKYLNPKWYKLTRILDGGVHSHYIYGNSYIGQMLVHD